MTEYNTKIFEVNGKKMQFDNKKFDLFFKSYCKEHQIKLGAFAEDISEKVGAIPEAVRNWRRGINGPSDLDRIGDLEKILGLVEGSLLYECTGGEKMSNLNDRQLTAAKKIYDAIIQFLNDFRNTDGFTTTCLDYQQQGNKNPIGATYDYLEGRMNELGVVLEQEYFDLRGTQLYTELNDYVYDDLIDIYNEKIGPAYRIKASAEGDGITTNDDYCDAMAKLNKILEKYL